MADTQKSARTFNIPNFFFPNSHSFLLHSGRLSFLATYS
jgi:hypothetical protein